MELPQFSYTQGIINIMGIISVTGQRLIYILNAAAQSSERSRACLTNKVFVLLVIVDYILMDPIERKRLFIENIPRMFPQRVIRAPVPWHSVYRNAKKWNEEHLHTVNPMMLSLKELWFTE